MFKTIKLRKSTFLLTVLIGIIALSGVVFAYSRIPGNLGGAGGGFQGGNAEDFFCLDTENCAVFTCPAKSGTCTATQTACDEDIPDPQQPRIKHACEYKCVNGAWQVEMECSQNLCNGAQCG